MATRKKSDTPKLDPVDAAITLAASQNWRDISMVDIATASGLAPAELFATYRSKSALLQAFARRIDAAMIAAAARDAADGSARDRLFAVIMARLDALAPFKPALRSILRDTAMDASMTLAMLCSVDATLRWTLELAGLSADGLVGAVRRKGLALIYADITRKWLKDDSADAGVTMAALDKNLARIESLAGRFRRQTPEKPA